MEHRRQEEKKKPGPPAWVLDFLFVLSPVAGPASCGELQSSYSQETCVSMLLTQGDRQAERNLDVLQPLPLLAKALEPTR